MNERNYRKYNQEFNLEALELLRRGDKSAGQIERELGEQLQQTSSLIGAAGLVLQDGNPQFAAQLLGAVDSALKGLNAVVESDMKFFYEDTLAKVKEALGGGGFQSAWEEGAQWSLEETVKKVLMENA